MAAQSKNPAQNHGILNRGFSRFRSAWDRVPSGSAEALHQARVQARRWAALCKLYDARRLGRIARQPAKKLADLRNVDVMLEHARSLNAEEALIHHLQCLRKEQWATLKPLFFSSSLQRLYGELTRGMRRLRDNSPAPENQAAKAALRQWQRRWKSVCRRPSAERWHALRIATKKLRYLWEAMRESGWPAPAGQIARLKALQRQLGLAHDLEILRLQAKAFGKPDKPFLKALKRQRDKALERAGKTAARSCR